MIGTHLAIFSSLCYDWQSNVWPSAVNKYLPNNRQTLTYAFIKGIIQYGKHNKF
ncbi:hypothetical protein K040078D81_61180 [Blautia hominis]|uniref:Uncharacterized protein n=1 Tax=Blautia hominis TaxID=2025493 RepID=A0ABQ0BKL4_9FIRM